MATEPKNAQLEADKKKLGEERERRAKATEEREKNKGTPTPTQEEADLLKLGHPVELAYDGSGLDPNSPPVPGAHSKDMHASEQHPDRGYETRQAGARQAQPQHQPQHPASNKS